MKNLRIVIFIVFIAFAYGKSNATSFDGAKTTVTKIQQGSGTPSYVYNNFFNNDIGTDTTGNKTYKARTQYEFDLTTIPSNSTIQNISLTYTVYHFNNGSYKFKITSVSTKSTAKDIYNAIDGTVLFTDIEYGSASGSKSNGSLNTLVNNKKGSKMYLGTFSENETTIGSGAQVDLILELEYSVKFTVDNNFTTSDGYHGKVKINGVQKTAPYLNTAYTDNTVHLEAIEPQMNAQGHQMIWHTGSTQKSKWERNGQYKSYNKNYSFTAKPDDNGKTYTANLREVITTTSGSLSQNESWFSTVNLSGNVTVPSGVTLTLEPEAIVNLNGHYIKSTGGSIVQESGSTINGLDAYLKYNSILKGFFPSITSAINNSGSNTTVELLSKTYNQNISTSKDYFTLQGKGYNSTYVNGSITFTNADHTGIKYLKTKTISTNNSYVDLYSLKADRFSIYGDEVQINYVRTNGGNQIPNQITNADGTVGNSNLEDMLIGMDMTSNSAYNVQSYFCGNDGDISAFSGSVAYAWYNDAFSYNPDYSCSGNVHYIWKNVCGMNKRTVNEAKEKVENTSKAKEDLEVIDQDYTSLLKSVNDEYVEKGEVDMKKYESDYNNVISDYKSFLEKYPTSVEAPTAIFRTIHCYQQQDNYKGYDEFINNFLADKKYDAIRPHVERHNIDLDVEEGHYKEAIEVADKIINNYKIDDNLYCELLYEKGLIYKYQLEDKESSEKMFKIIVDNYPDNKMVSYAEIELGNERIKKEEEQKNVKPVSDNFEIVSYPNPFNPSTTLSYSLPTTSNVKLEIYDVMGRLIKSFTTNSQSSGTHKVVWDGTNSNGITVSTGIYIYRFEATSLETNGHFVKSAKLMLIK